MAASKTQAEIAGIQYVRGIAACLVVINHISAVLGGDSLFGSAPLGHILFKGSVGVDLFFVVSGFIIVAVSLQRETLAPRLSVSEYVAKRAARILPFLWLCVLAYAVVRFAGTGKYEPVPYLNAMFLWPLGEVRPNVVWTLRHEALFYIVFALSFLGRTRRPYLLLAWCLSPLLLAAIDSPLDVEGNVLHELAAFAFNPSNLTFGWGVLLGLAYLRLPLFLESRRFPPSLTGGAMLAACISLFLVFTDFGSAPVNVLATLVVFISLWMPASNGKLARLGHVLGDASYSIYLTHNLVFLIAGTAWVALFGTRFYYAALLLLPVIAVLFGVLVHYWVERPLVRCARHALQRFRQRRGKPAEALAE